MDVFFLLLAFVLGIVAYAIVIHFLPGTQPGEDRINELIAHFKNNTAAVIANTAAIQTAQAVPLTAGQPTVVKSGDTTVKVTWTPESSTGTDETPVQWAARTGSVSATELIAFDAFAHKAPASMTYSDILIAFNAQRAAT